MKKVIKINSTYLYVNIRTPPPILAPTHSWGYWFQETRIYTTWWCFNTSFQPNAFLTFVKTTKTILISLLIIIISPWKRAWPFIKTNKNSFQQIIFCAKFGNWPSCSGEVTKCVKSFQTNSRPDNRTDGKTDAGQKDKKPYNIFKYVNFALLSSYR